MVNPLWTTRPKRREKIPTYKVIIAKYTLLMAFCETCWDIHAHNDKIYNIRRSFNSSNNDSSIVLFIFYYVEMLFMLGLGTSGHERTQWISQQTFPCMLWVICRCFTRKAANDWVFYNRQEFFPRLRSINQIHMYTQRYVMYLTHAM